MTAKTPSRTPRAPLLLGAAPALVVALALAAAGCDRAAEPPPPQSTGQPAGLLSADDAFRLGVESTPEAVAELLGRLPEDASAEVLEAAALGLGYSRTETAGPALVQICLRDRPPEIGLQALYAHYRGPGRTPPKTLPAAGLIRYAGLTAVRARAGVGWLARVVHDERLLGPVIALTLAPEAEVRRAAAIGLAKGGDANGWDDEQSGRCVEALLPLTADPEPRVVVAACRALSSHDGETVVAALHGTLGHADFNVRVAAIEGLARRAAETAVADLERLARDDDSVSVRYAAAMALAALDADRARGLADELLAAPEEYLRAAGCQVLAGGGTDAGTDGEPADGRLVRAARDDAHPRVRQAALEALTGKQDAAAVGALRHALTEERDPVVVAVACGVAAEGRIEALRDLVRAVPARFPTFDGADAREGALAALAAYARLPASEDAAPEEKPRYELPAGDRAVLQAHVEDPHPAVAFTAAKSLAQVDGAEAPEPERTGGPRGDESDLDGTGDVLVVKTSKGVLRIRLYPDQAPLHCRHVAALAARGFYDGLTWHRVVPDFVIQGGCPRGDGAGSAGVSLPLEPTRIPFDRGVLGMPRSAHPDSGGCQLFIMHSRAPHLDVQYTAFGRVVEGLDVVDRIDVDDTIVSVRVEPGDGR